MLNDAIHHPNVGILDIRDHAVGCLLGGAMGDSFGYPIEFKPLEEIKSAFGKEGLKEPLLRGGYYMISDDTQMSLLTADGLLCALTRWCTRGLAAPPYNYIYRKYRRWAQLQGFETDDESFADSWLFSDPAMYAMRAPGNTCINELCRNADPATMDSPRNDSKGCGGLMRVAPVGLFCRDYGKEKAVRLASEIAATTHGHPYGYMTAGMLSSMIYHIAQGEDLHQSVSNAEADCREFFGDPMIDGLCSIIDNAVDLSESVRGDEECMRSLGEGWVAEETLAMAVFACLRHSDDAIGCLRCAVNVTGDSDSIGSVAGNIIGAYLGADAIKKSFDTDRLECSEMIEVIAVDLVTECPSYEFGPSDAIWDAKYIYCTNPYSDRTRNDEAPQ